MKTWFLSLHPYYIEGQWRDDELNGWGVYHCADGSRREGEWVGGSLSGRVREFNADGNETFNGEYEGGARQGWGILRLPDGGTLEGEWHEGELSGRCCYRYPSTSHDEEEEEEDDDNGGGAASSSWCLKGDWREGEMARAVFEGPHTPAADRWSAWQTDRRVPRPANPDAAFFREHSRRPGPGGGSGLRPVQDPYEAARVAVVWAVQGLTLA